MKKLTFLGTGHGMPVQSSCTAILLQEGGLNLMFDAGGGHDILNRFHEQGTDPSVVDHLFISHYDSDHILGIVPMMRTWHSWAEPRQRMIFCSQAVKAAIESLFTFVAKGHYEVMKKYIKFVVLDDGLEYTLGSWRLKFFDIQSTKVLQYGCHLTFSDGEMLAFLGDEPLNEHYLDIVECTDILIHEAFCLDSQKEEFQPHQKHHGTVKEAAENATKLGAKKLLFYHMEDRTLASRKEKYMKEAKEYFSGEIFVPIDGDVFTF